MRRHVYPAQKPSGSLRVGSRIKSAPRLLAAAGMLAFAVRPLTTPEERTLRRSRRPSGERARQSVNVPPTSSQNCQTIKFQVPSFRFQVNAGQPNLKLATWNLKRGLVLIILPRVRRDGHVLDNAIDELVFGGFLGRHEAIAIRVALDLVQRMARVLDQNLVHLLLDPLELLGVDGDFFGGARHAGQRLMDHDASVGQGVPLAGSAGGEQDGAHRSGLADAIGCHVAGDELHRVVDGQPRADAAAGAVDVEVYVGLGIVRLQEQELRDDDIGHLVIHLGAQKDDAVLEQAAVDVIDPLFTTALFNDIRNQRHIGNSADWQQLVFVFFRAGHLLQYVIDQAIFLRVFGAEEKVAVSVFGDAVHRLARVLGQDFVEHLPVTQNFVGLNFNVTDLSLHAAVGLMQHDASVWQSEPLALAAAGQEHRRAAG